LNTVLVDLDGTITDPAPGIIGAFQYALEHLGVRVPDAHDLGWVIGPPLRSSFAKLIGPRQDVEEAVRLYREHYGAGGLFKATVYAGMADALEGIRGCSARLFVCTSKLTVFAQRIVEHFGIGAVFDGIYGTDLEGRFDDKGDLIGQMLSVEGIDPARTIMIGDRASDVAAASRHGIPTIGVTWGYGGIEELTKAGAALLCDAPDQLAPTTCDLLRR
jgi:phosphoglycolate phosphatase